MANDTSTYVAPALTAKQWADAMADGVELEGEHEDVYDQQPGCLIVHGVTLELVPGGGSPDDFEHEEDRANWFRLPSAIRVIDAEGIVGVHQPHFHALAALALHDQPFGFTAADVVLLRKIQRRLSQEMEGMGVGQWRPFGSEIDSLAARISALLPP